VEKVRLAVDAMGGDHAPVQIIKGVEKAIKAFSDLEITLIGNEAEIRKTLQLEDRIQILHTEEVIHSDEDPARAFRRKKDASMVLAAKEVKEGRADACLSAGSTGAYLATALFVIGRIGGIIRPALAPMLPTMNGDGFVLMDVGANAEAKPEYLLQFALMGSIYAEKVRGIKNPRVALLNIGTEDNKGNDLTKEAFDLLSQADLNFIGNVESRYLLEGVADVVVTDGFTGNMVLKTIEGTASSLMKMIKELMTSNFQSKMGALLLKSKMMELKQLMDYKEYGGAALFGVKAPVIKAHGSSDAFAFYNAIRQARSMVQSDLATEISKKLSE